MGKVHFSGPVISTAGFSVDGTTTTVAADLAKITGITNGTSAPGKAVVLDTNSAINAMNVTTLSLGAGAGTAVTATAAELNATVHGCLATAAEINLNCTQNAANIETLSANGANTMTLTKHTHKIDTTAGAQTTTPAAPGAANLGVYHLVEMTVRGGSNNAVWTPTNMDGAGISASLTFNAAGQYAILVGGATKWHIIDTTATVA